MIESLDQNQIIFIVTAMIASAIVTGFMAGFFGIGGGLIMVPILILPTLVDKYRDIFVKSYVNNLIKI